MPSIKEKPEKSKYLARCLKNTRLFVAVCAFLAGVIIFGSIELLMAFDGQSAGVRVAEDLFEVNLSGKMGAYVGSKTGKSYYFPWCGTVNRIKDANLVWFPNRAVAEAKGYNPASNCRGLK